MAMTNAERQKKFRDKHNGGKAVQLKANQERELVTLASELVSRAALASKLGMSYGAARDIYTALGYPKTLDYSNFEARHKRQDIAKRVVDMPASATWRGRPKITENEDIETPFEKAWEDLLKSINVYHYFSRVDKISGIGRYAILLMGFDDGEDLSMPLKKARQLLYLKPYSENSTAIKSWVQDSQDKRFGLPEEYDVKMFSGDSSAMTRRVHHSRVLHISEGLLENDVYGTPRLEAVYNRLQDLELVSGGSAEMFWRGALPGYAFTASPDADMSTQAAAGVEDAIDEYLHGFKRYLKLMGLDVKSLAPQVADPTGHVDIYLKLIAGTTGIPVRILTGSERGELASSQDETNWNARVDERRKEYAEPMILRAFIDRLTEAGVLPIPKEGYSVEWPDMFALDEEQKAKISESKARAIATYISAPGADAMIPPEVFLEDILGLDRDKIDKIREALEGIAEEEEPEEPEGSPEEFEEAI